MPRKSNAQQREPQWEDLNVHVKLSAIHHAQCSFTMWARVASISRQSALIAWHNAFKVTGPSDKNKIVYFSPLNSACIEYRHVAGSCTIGGRSSRVPGGCAPPTNQPEVQLYYILYCTSTAAGTMQWFPGWDTPAAYTTSARCCRGVA